MFKGTLLCITAPDVVTPLDFGCFLVAPWMQNLQQVPPTMLGLTVALAGLSVVLGMEPFIETDDDGNIMMTTPETGALLVNGNDILASLAMKANAADVYTKAGVDDVVAMKADASTLDGLASKSDIDALVADLYTKREVDSKIASAISVSDVYNKSEVDHALALKADKSDALSMEVLFGRGAEPERVATLAQVEDELEGLFSEVQDSYSTKKFVQDNFIPKQKYDADLARLQRQIKELQSCCGDEPPKPEPSMQPTSPPPPPAPPAGGITWTIGKAFPAQNCDEACAVLTPAKKCSQSSLDALQGHDATRLIAAFQKANHDCTKPAFHCEKGNNCVSWGSPYIHNSHFEQNMCWGGSKPRVAPCGQRPVDHHHRRLCPCTD